MPKGHEFSVELKKVMFQVIEFVDSEKDGLKIPLTSTCARIMALLGIGRHPSGSTEFRVPMY
jgi:hypothetical protein